MQGFRRLQFWEKAHDLTLEVYKATVRLPKEEIYALSSQIKRAAASIGANMPKAAGEGVMRTSRAFC